MFLFYKNRGYHIFVITSILIILQNFSNLIQKQHLDWFFQEYINELHHKSDKLDVDFLLLFTHIFVRLF